MKLCRTIYALICRAGTEAAVGVSILSGQLQLWDDIAIVTAMSLVGTVVCSASCVLRLVVEDVTSESPQEEQLRRFLAHYPRVTSIEPSADRAGGVLYRAPIRARLRASHSRQS
jgi:hypothetical protein